MKTKFIFATVVSLVCLSIIAVIDWQSGPASPPAEEPNPALALAPRSVETPAETTGSFETPLPSEPAPIPYQAAYGSVSTDSFQARLNGANGFQMPALLSEIERMPDSPVKDEMMRTALMKWAGADGAAAATWARLRAQYRRFLPDILQAWAGGGADAAASAWKFATTAFSADRDEAAWRSPTFVTAAFRGMTAKSGEAVWNELASLTGTSAIHAMMGMADFASNGQINTDFAAEMESRTLGLGSAPLSAAFYAAAGHTAAAKGDLAAVTDGSQWHVIAREIARQQAVFEPSKAIDWLQSQFPKPADGIEDMVESIGMTHALNAEDVLGWLRNLPENNEQAAGLRKILQKFPALRSDLVVENISVK